MKLDSESSGNEPKPNRVRTFLTLTPRQWVSCTVLSCLIVLLFWMIEYGELNDSGHPAGANPVLAAARLGSSFDLSTCLIPRDEIRSGGPPPDGIPAITRPAVLSSQKASYLRDTDRVIGVAIGGQSRAYPLRILNWHENVNDVLGSRPIAVTYCPLCDSAAAFDRDIGGQVREFGISGLLYNSNVLFFDRQESREKSSLWSQLQMRAVAGPAAKAGLTLVPLPCELTTWLDWKRRHPQTTVLSRKTGYQRNYDSNPYTHYFRTDKLMFPVSPRAKPPAGLGMKERLIVLRVGRTTRAYPVRTVATRSGTTGWIEDKVGEMSVRLHYEKDADSVRVAPTDGKTIPPAAFYTFWFAWRAMYPDGTMLGNETAGGFSP